MRDDRETFDRLVETAHPVHPDRLKRLRTLKSGGLASGRALFPGGVIALVTVLVAAAATVLLSRTENQLPDRRVAVAPTATAPTVTGNHPLGTTTPDRTTTSKSQTGSQVNDGRAGGRVISREEAIERARGGACTSEAAPELIGASLGPYLKQLRATYGGSVQDSELEGRGIVADDAPVWLVRWSGTFIPNRVPHGKEIKPQPGEMYVLINAATGGRLGDGCGPVSAADSDGGEPSSTATPTNPALADQTVRLGGSQIILAPATEAPKIGKERAIEIARTRVGEVTIVEKPHAANWLATNPEEDDPTSPRYMQKLPVWVVTFQTLSFERPAPGPSDIQPNPEPVKVHGQAQVVINGDTGEYILTVEKSEATGFVEGTPASEEIEGEATSQPTDPTPTQAAQLADSGIVLAPATVAPKINREQAIRIARGHLAGGQYFLNNPKAVHVSATDTSTDDQDGSRGLQKQPVWLVSFQKVTLGKLGPGEDDINPMPMPTKTRVTTYALVDSQTGKVLRVFDAE